MIEFDKLFVEDLGIAHLFMGLQAVVDIRHDLVYRFGFSLSDCFFVLQHFLQVDFLFLVFLHGQDGLLLAFQGELKLLFEFDQIQLEFLDLHFFGFHSLLHLCAWIETEIPL